MTMLRWHIAILSAALMAGCQSAARKPPYSDNPLVASRQPLIHSAAERERAAQAARNRSPQTLPPPVPLGPETPATSVATVEAPPPPSWDAPSPTAAAPEPPPPALTPLPARTMTDGPLLPPPIESSVPTPASAIGAAAGSLPPSPRTLDGPFGFSADRTWLKGELDRHYRGYLELRYRRPAEEDTFGGKVRLEDDPRLGEFRSGDIVAVDGEMIHDGNPSAGQYPRFRIRSIRLVERKP
jgi:hypothetical protein